MFLISSGAIVDIDGRVGENSHLASGVNVAKGAVIAPFSRIPSGAVVNSAK